MMMKRKWMLPGVMATALVLPAFLVSAAPNGSSAVQSAGEIASKDEVVYATLSATGAQREIYVVNNFDVQKAGTITDYGRYESVKNLTDLTEIEQKDGTVAFEAPEGKFYYQGNMDNEPLPWKIAVSYELDGKRISPEELAGKDGHVEITISTSPNGDADPVFFENYLLQISLTLDGALFSNIQSDEGMIANAGKNKQVTFNVMPEKKAELRLEADAVDFELAGIDIAGVPSTLSIDAPNVDEMTGEMDSLSDAILQLRNGVGELNTGVTQLNEGASQLQKGSAQYRNGISQLSASSGELVDASVSIQKALKSINEALGQNPGNGGTGGLGEMQAGLAEIANALKETSRGLDSLGQNYNAAYGQLNEAMAGIPEYKISEQQIQELYESGADPKVIDQLVKTYYAARTAKGTYAAVKQGFDAVHPALQQMSGGLEEMANNLERMANGLASSLESMGNDSGLAQLQDGMADLASNYHQFHSGLVEYTKGTSQLANSYTGLDAGISELSGGVKQLAGGTSQLYTGSNQLYDATRNLPEQMKKEIDQMIAEFENADFEAVSFVSEENNDTINTVQFIIKTEKIAVAEEETAEEQPEEKKGIWARFLDLFS